MSSPPAMGEEFLLALTNPYMQDSHHCHRETVSKDETLYISAFEERGIFQTRDDLRNYVYRFYVSSIII